MKEEKDHVKDGMKEEKGSVQNASEQQEAAAQDGVAENAAPAEENNELSAALKKIAGLEAENADLKDQLLRRAADFDNYRKRMIKEKQEASDYANTNLLVDLLESIDNFDRTVAAAATASDPKAIAEGVGMVSKNLVSLLENKYGLASYGEKGDDFDPDLHQAIGSVQGPVKTPVLADVYLKGYKLRDRVIRHAKVMVTMPGAAAGDEKAQVSDGNQPGEE